VNVGRSTLQNELIGDIEAEFGPVPEGAEDMPLKVLGSNLAAGREVRLGTQSMKIISRLIASKMPARFNLGTALKYMAEKWGLGQARQSSVLLYALTSEPKSRLGSIQAAEEFIDGLTSRYAQSCGLVLRSQLPQARSVSSATETVNPAILEEFSRGQKRLAKKQAAILEEFLQNDSSQGTEIAQLEMRQNSLQVQLDAWNSEFPEDFAEGIKPRFNPKRSRRYNAWWNLVREDIISLCNNIEQPQSESLTWYLQQLQQRIINRSTLPALAQIQRLSAPSQRLFSSEKDQLLLGQLARQLQVNLHQQPKFQYTLPVKSPRTEIDETGSIKYVEVPRKGLHGCADFASMLRGGTKSGSRAATCFNLKLRCGSEWKPNREITEQFLDLVSAVLNAGVSFADKVVLVTGAGQGSIGAECVRALLMGGAYVIVTTSREPSDTSSFYRKLYEECGSKNSELIVLPLNQGSVSDCDALIDHIYSDTGLSRDLDAILPFAAMSEVGHELDALHGKPELAHRLMLVNVLRLLGRIIVKKRERNINCHPTQVLLPLSPNHGMMGGDGLYAESKLGLESLLRRVSSESWSDELIICGVIIGWTRGTSLMSSNDFIAEEIERHNVLTFSQEEMAFNIVMLMTKEVVGFCENEPVVADFGGGLENLEDCKSIILQARAKIESAVQIAKAVHEEDKEENALLDKHLESTSEIAEIVTGKHRSRLKIAFPPLPDFESDLRPLERLHDMVDLDSVVVVVGFSELGPWGNSRTRWEIESRSSLSQTGFLEMAWIMNLIKHFNGQMGTGHYVGWIDVKTGEQVQDYEIEGRYGKRILEHSGLRFVDPEAPGGYDPTKKEYLQEISIEEDLPEFRTTRANAEAFKLKHGDNVHVQNTSDSDEYSVQLKRGAHIQVAKTSPFNRGLVAGQIPTGWNPATYGIQEDLINQVDPATLYTLCCVSEALYSAGITDSMEIFRHIHLSEMGNFIGSSMGGPSKTRAMYKDVHLDKDVQSDIIQETYLNTPAAWVNMLLLGSTGPIKTPVGACATGVESIDNGLDSIMSGKTKMSLVGGVDDFQEDESFGFSKMQATADALEQLAQGRLPPEMSRPIAETRAGFVESHGCGVQIICAASLAIEMGLPIYGIIAASTMAADKISRSVPAPGQGVLTFARETPCARNSPLLDLEYRREQMRRQIRSLRASVSDTPLKMDSESSSFVLLTPSEEHQLEDAQPSIRAAKRHWGNDFRKQNPDISPLRASLAVWGLTVDDIDIASLHGTSTKANDKNEPDVINKQMEHLGREPGHPLLAICQKSITGHPKAPAAAWMLNGCLQTLSTGLIPGNRNADNVDPVLQKFEHLMFPTRAIQTKEVKAFLLTSFGFGQKGGQIVGIAPKYLFATLNQDQYETYASKFKERAQLADRAYVKALLSNKIVRAYEAPAYDVADESKVFLNPSARVTETIDGELHFNSSDLDDILEDIQHTSGYPLQSNAMNTTAADLALAARISKAWIENQARSHRHDLSNVGIDTVNLKSFTADSNEVFLKRNYTEAELKHANESLDPHATLAGRWCAKEAVFKSLGAKSKGAGAALGEIEIVNMGGAPGVKVGVVPKFLTGYVY
jgi:fatty acid synthase subunit alpha